jgi:hypothetical protein
MAHHTTQDRPSLHLTRGYPVAPEKVWQAWTDPQALSAAALVKLARFLLA